MMLFCCCLFVFLGAGTYSTDVFISWITFVPWIIPGRYSALRVTNISGVLSSFLSVWGRGQLLPRKLTWNPKMEVWKMIFLFNWVIFRFHVNFQGCNG